MLSMVACNDKSWYSISAVSPYEPERKITGKVDVTVHPQKCVGCARKFKTMKRTQEYCSTACFALGNKSDKAQPPDKPETVQVSILGPPSKRRWAIDRRKKTLSDIREVQDVLAGVEV